MNLTNGLLLFIWASQVGGPWGAGAYIVGALVMLGAMGRHVDERKNYWKNL